MKDHLYSCMRVGIAGLTASVIHLNAQTISSPPYQQLLPSVEQPSGEGLALLPDPFNTGALLFGTWNWPGNGWTHTITRLTPDNAEWTSFDVEGLDSGLLSVRRLGYNPNDRLYAIGQVDMVIGGSPKNPTKVTQWKVRSSVSGAAGTWVDEDTFGFVAASGKGKTTAQWSQGYGMTTDSHGASVGNVYTCGIASDGQTYHWIIRRKGSDRVWRTVYDAKAADSLSIPYSMAFFPGTSPALTPAVFAVGIFNSRWTILRSQDQGNSWDPVDDLWPEDGAMASAYSIECGPEGNIYVCGTRGRDGINRGWVLRVSQNGGSTWETLLDQPSTSPSWAWSLGVDAGGNVIVTGCIVDPLDGTQRWTILRNAPDQTWADSWATPSQPLGDINSSGARVLPGLGGAAFISGRMTDPADGTLRIALLRMVQ